MNASSASISDARRYYALGLLTVVYAFNFIDRQILVILQEAIKADLGLMDWQLGLLSGFAFALLYVIAGVPIARLADRGNRRNIIAASIAVWSTMTALCGAATSFFQLLLARMGVGIGEAGCSPPAHSIITDLFKLESRATALAVYNTGISAGVFVGFLLGGWINEFFGWRWAFIIAAAPGILLTLLVRFTLPEPERGMSEDKPVAAAEAPPVMAVAKLLWSRKSLRHISLAAGLHAFVNYGLTGWIAPFLIRVHEVGTGELANWLAPIIAIPSALGALVGGYLCDKYGKSNVNWYVFIPAICTLVALPIQYVFYFHGDFRIGLLIFAIPIFLNATYLAPTFAMVHGLVSLRMRAVASSILFLVINLIGLGLGPLFTGILSDIFTASWGTKEGIRWALAIVSLVNIWAAAHYFLTARTLKQDLANAPK